ncbi:MAG: nuclear transport factor 2 family protein [Verrucomicrobiota bacterium]
MNEQDWLDTFSPAIDTMNPDNVLNFLSEGCIFQAGNLPPIRDKEEIRKVFVDLYDRIHSIKHTLEDRIVLKDKAVYRGRVHYVRNDGSELDVPFCDVFRIRNQQIVEYLIYIDWHELY